MLIRILSFLLDTLFFVLIGAALLRAWMNRLRVNMSAQPGVFVMAVSDWLVKPLRRALPKAVAQSRVDWASLLAALLLALLYALLWAALVGALLNLTADMLPALLLTGLKMLLRVALQHGCRSGPQDTRGARPFQVRPGNRGRHGTDDHLRTAQIEREGIFFLGHIGHGRQVRPAR